MPSVTPLVDHLVGCGWNRRRTVYSATGTAVLLTATAHRAEGLDAYLMRRVPVQFADWETVS
ncbi:MULTISPECIES: hypothetical protein [Streptomyces]|uniref:Uncharacterized protein n=1 Tax=Streptomyces griseiscabiei TaxID=2993540 RepID=A0ABU4LFH4_9ACTN|nr:MULTISPECIES: hypothetical protein [Streptomyces]MBZ3908427.1 hypothetical protein [Streptomyces griseiscabiei]MDX2913944.1 hypothetical protein [Streptomyces griseiscabiei]